ncbi:MAG: DUF4153 domain-containing protein [Actinomycetota bacterium]
MNEVAGGSANKTSAPTRIALAALGAGTVAGLLLVGHGPGVNWLLVAAAVAATVASVAWRGALSSNALTFGTLSLALTATAVHTATEWQLVLNLLVALGLASLAVAPARTWSEFLLGFGAAWWRSPGALAWLLRVRHRPPANGAASATLRLARGLALGGFLLVVFGALFASADQAFAQLADRVLAVPDVSFGLLPARLVVAGTVALFTAALASFTPALGVGRGGPVEWIVAFKAEFGDRKRRCLGRTEWITALSMLDALFVLFVVVQITVLFGGREHVLATSELTYAEYARTGFFQLVSVAALTLLVLGFFARYAQRTRSHDVLLLKILGGVLVALTLVVLASALRRLSLYEEVYGFTRLRLVVHAAILWLAALFGIVTVAGIRTDARWVPRAVVVVSTLSLLAFTLMRPDAFIAERNVERFAETGKIDLSYLSDLSPDAVPALATLPEPERSCALASLRYELAESESLWSLNLARDTAREVLNHTPESTSALQACPHR